MQLHNKTLLWAFTVLLVIVLGFAVVQPVQAVEFDDDGVVPEDAVIDDDLFIAHDTVEINGTVTGDVFAAGGAVKVNGNVEGSLVTGAQSIILNGTVDGSVYAGASTFSLEPQAVIGRNLYYGGFNLSTEEGSRIGRDLLVGAYQALLSGTIERDVQAGVGALDLTGSVGGDVFAEVGSPEDDQGTMFFGGPPGVETIVPAGIRISEDARIAGTLTYKSSQQQAAGIKGTPAGGVEYKYDPEPTGDEKARDVGFAAMIGSWIVKRVRIFVTLLVLGGLVIWQMPQLFERVNTTVKEDLGPTLGWGLVTIIVVYAGAAILAGLIIALGIFFGVITLGGLSKTILGIGFSSLGLVLAIFGLIVSYGSKLVVSFTGGKLILDQMAPEAAQKPIWPLLLGIVIYVVLRAVPIIGFWIGALVTIIGVGALWLVYRNREILPETESI